MHAKEIQRIVAEAQFTDLGQEVPLNISEMEGYTAIDGHVIFPLSTVDFSIQNEEELEIIDESGLAIGSLCCCKFLGPIVPTELTRARLFCYLVDLPKEIIESPYTFRRDYVVINEPFARTYISTYRTGSAIWGGFVHLEDDTYVASKFTRADKRLVAHPRVAIPTVAHKEALARGLRSISHEVRFLHYYHQIELLFDMILVKEIQRLGSDLNGIGALLKSYAWNELDRMQDLAQKYVEDIKDICSIIAGIEGYKDRLSHIADDFGKNSNPLSDERVKVAFWQMVATGTVSSKEAQNKRFASNDGEFRMKIIKIVCYWIYRLRCSVVHHRIGEYILKDEDDDLIVEVGERLTRCVLTSMFQNTKLQALFYLVGKED